GYNQVKTEEIEMNVREATGSTEQTMSPSANEEAALPDPTRFRSDLAVVCALEEKELEAVLRLPWQWEEYRADDDPSQFYRGNFMRAGASKIAYAAAAQRTGIHAAAVLATKIILHVRHR